MRGCKKRIRPRAAPATYSGLCVRLLDSAVVANKGTDANQSEKHQFFSLLPSKDEPALQGYFAEQMTRDFNKTTSLEFRV